MFATQIAKHVYPIFDCSSALVKQFSTSALRSVGFKWRRANGYPDNYTARGVLTDGPDYSFADGRPTPYTAGQRKRVIKQQEYADRIQQLLGVIDDSKKAYREKLETEKKEKEQILGRKLKPKGKAFRTRTS